MGRLKFERKLHEARELRKRGAELLFDRVALLVQCHDDEAFVAWCASQEIEPIDYLNDELSDTATTFVTLRAVLEHYPERESWAKHNIRDLIAEIIEMQQKDRQDDGRPKRPSWKDRAIKAEAEIERLRAELATYKESLGIVASAGRG